MAEYVMYEGDKFRIQSSGRYYQDDNKKAAERLLHRRIWTDHYGAIPEGYVIHHKDHNWRNNDITNLQLIDAIAHKKQHAKECYKNPEYVAKNKISIKKAIESAKKWHKSKEGRSWHAKHAKKTWQKREKETIFCIKCAKPALKHFKNRKNVRFCSTKCEGAAYYKNNRIEANCKACDKEFMRYKYRNTLYCSRLCSNRHRFSKAGFHGKSTQIEIPTPFPGESKMFR